MLNKQQLMVVPQSKPEILNQGDPLSVLVRRMKAVMVQLERALAEVDVHMEAARALDEQIRPIYLERAGEREYQSWNRAGDFEYKSWV